MYERFGLEPQWNWLAGVGELRCFSGCLQSLLEEEEVSIDSFVDRRKWSGSPFL